MKNREVAIEWWNTLSIEQEYELVKKHLGENRNSTFVTGREVEFMYNIEKSTKNNTSMVELVYNDEHQPIGWKMVPKTEEEHRIVAEIRDLQFFGGFTEGNHIEYYGLTLIDPSKGKCEGNIKSLTWVQEKYKEN